MGTLATYPPILHGKKRLGDGPKRQSHLQGGPQKLNIILSEQRAKHLIFDAELAGEPIQVTIDSGANQNYVSKRISKKLETYKTEKDLPYPIQNASNHIMGLVEHELRNIPLRIGQYEKQTSLDIIDVPDCDVVLGMAWLHDNNPDID